MSEKLIIHGKEYDKDYIAKRGKELAKKYKDEWYWKLTDKENFIWQWDIDKEIYIPEYSDKQL